MSKRKTKEEFIKEVYSKSGEEYEVVGDYINTQVKILMKHNICGNVWGITPNKFSQGRRCPKCSVVAKKTNESFVAEVKNKYGNEYAVLSNYNGAFEKIKVRHNVCGNTYEVRPTHIVNKGTGCPFCHIHGGAKNHEQFLKDVKPLTDNGFIIVGKYLNENAPIKIKHELCNYEWEAIPKTLVKLSGVKEIKNKCPRCGKNIKINHDEFCSRVNELTEDEYLVKGVYLNNKKNVLMVHNKCGSAWSIKPYDFFNGVRCPNCKQKSRGETSIEKWLNERNIEYIRNYRFDDCKYKNKLSFDFAILLNGKVNTLIEFDGKQHYKPVKFGESTETANRKFKLQTERDNIKNSYCKSNNIKLIRIPYWKIKEIDSVLKRAI